MEGRTRWILDPFMFLARALALPPVPMLDVTTENGRRILTSHIDGDGFVSVSEMPQRKLAGEVILEDILRRYPVPTTVSVIEARDRSGGNLPRTVGPAGRYRPRHLPPPLRRGGQPRLQPPLRLGRRRAPPGRHPARSHPPAGPRLHLRSRARDRRLGGLHRSPVAARRQADAPVSLERKRPAQRPGGGGHPAARPAQREWRQRGDRRRGHLADPRELPGPAGDGRLSGLRAPPEREQLHQPVEGALITATGAPSTCSPTPSSRAGSNRSRSTTIFIRGPSRRRSRPCARSTTGRSAQEIIPLYLSDYARKVEDFQQATLARTLDGAWELRRLRALRTVRFDERLGWPDLEGRQRGRGAAGRGPGPLRLVPGRRAGARALPSRAAAGPPPGVGQRAGDLAAAARGAAEAASGGGGAAARRRWPAAHEARPR